MVQVDTLFATEAETTLAKSRLSWTPFVGIENVEDTVAITCSVD